MPLGLTSNSILLIPKIANGKYKSNLRPISLCNVLYKIIAKVLAYCLRYVLRHVISCSHGAFIKEILLTDNVMIA